MTQIEVKEHPVCEKCGRFLAEGLDEWDDSPEMLCDCLQSACVRIIEDGKVLCVSRKDGRGWCLPGGKIEQGEISLAGAQRELLEETGILVEARNLRYVCEFSYTGPSGTRLVSLYETHWWLASPFTLSQSPEGLEMVWMAWKDLVKVSPFSEFYSRCPPPDPDACTGCGSANCSHLWASQRKCCPDCSHK